jgi:hypothetical protein
MNRDQVMSIIRQILMFGGGVAVSRGWIDSETLLAVVGAIVALAGTAWSLWFHAGPDKADAVAVATDTATLAQKTAVAKATA